MWLKERRNAIARLLGTIGQPIDRPCRACGVAARRACRPIDGVDPPGGFHASRYKLDDGPLFGDT